MQISRTTKLLFCKSILFLGICILLQTSARADLIINRSGVIGSPVVDFELAGSVIVPNNISATNSATYVLVPQTSGTQWGQAPPLPGDPVKLDAGVDLSAVGSYFDDGSLIYTFSEIEFLSGTDSVRLRQPSSSHPFVSAGSVLSWTGSGTFTLPSSFENHLNTGSYSGSIGGGSYVVNVSAIPEPSSLTLLALIAGLHCACFRRRRFR